MSRFRLLAGFAAVLSCLPVGALNVPKIDAQALVRREALQESYDYVIIGGGTAGLTVGDRLSEDGKNSVLVIEFGDFVNSNETNWARDRVVWRSEPGWLYHVVSAPNKELNNLQTNVDLASMVGGCSAINGMQVIRGTRVDYDRWGSFFGSGSSWTWEGMLPYIKKALHFQPPSEEAVAQMPGLKYDLSYWGNTSREYAGWASFQWPGIKYQFNAFTALPGVEVPVDSGAGQTGVYWYPTYMDAYGTHNRSYSRTSHWDGLNRANYHIRTNSKVTKIELTGNKATGISFRPSREVSNGTLSSVKAKKEIILSAGAVHSPQVLQLSGIGPRKVLESAGIKTKIELPGVGQNFHDHNTLNYIIKFENYTVYPNRRDNFTQPSFIAWADELWNANKTGPWSRGLWNTGAWLSMPIVAPDAYESIAAKVDAQNAADYLPAGTHKTVIAGYQAQLATLAKGIRSKDEVFYSHYFSGDEPVTYITYEHPLSSGTININITNPDADPIVDYRTYSNPVDFDIMMELGKFHRRINVESPLLQQFDPVETSPGLNTTTREQWIAYMRDNTYPTAEHPSGTCAMLPLELGGVVDEELKVYGVESLRVVDASVMSVIVGANIAGTVYAIAEKAADIIKSEHTY